ncbi:MAG TPA: SRPBCC family protein [Streptosporangiaceae bacterium]|jgi:uncharacterized protein YndB with AHSA1/START domain
MDAGTYVELDGRPAVRFQRDYHHPVQRLWSAITDPDELPHWFPSKVTMKPEVGGTIEFTGDGPPSSGTILVYEPPTRLAYSWGDNELRFELEPIGDHGCRLTLIDVLPAKNVAARNAAGWEVCLAELDKHVAGDVAAGPHAGTREAWRRHYDSYVAAGMPSGAEIPGG